jgi:hypothetical protein
MIYGSLKDIEPGTDLWLVDTSLHVSSCEVLYVEVDKIVGYFNRKHELCEVRMSTDLELESKLQSVPLDRLNLIMNVNGENVDFAILGTEGSDFDAAEIQANPAMLKPMQIGGLHYRLFFDKDQAVKFATDTIDLMLKDLQNVIDSLLDIRIANARL